MNPELQTPQLPSPEATLRRDHIAMVLSKEGPYSVSNGFLDGFRRADQSTRIQFMADVRLVANLLGAKNLTEAKRIIDDQKTMGQEDNRINKRALSIYSPEMIVNSQKENARAKKIQQYANIADAFINSYMRTGAWEPISQSTDLSEEVQSTATIAGLLNILFSTDYSQRVRFEAKRKLLLMHIAASLDVRSAELAEQDRYPEFIKFLNNYIWHKEPGGAGPTKQVTLLSRHRFEDYETLGVEEINTEQEKEVARRRIANHHPRKGGYFLRETLLDQRQIEYNGELISVYYDSRPKALLSRMGKIIRRGQEDPAVAVQDTTGLLMVVPSNADAYKLFKHIASGGKSRSNLIKIEELEDTLNGGDYSAENQGSSPKVRQLKFIARHGGTSIEMIIHTRKTYLDYKYHDEIAHEGYEIKRFVKSGAFDLIFPKKLYGVDSSDAEDLIERQAKVRRL